MAILARFEVIIEGDELTPEVEEGLNFLRDDITDLVDQTVVELGVTGDVQDV